MGAPLGARVDSACFAVVGRGGKGPRQGMRTRTRAITLVWLLAFGLAALGTGDALSAPRHKDIRAHRSKSAATAGHKRGTAPDAKQHTAPSQSEESHEAVTLLPPDLAAAKQAIELIRKGKWKDATALRHRSVIRWRGSSSNGHCCAAPIAPPDFERYVAFIRPIPIGPGHVGCADAPRRGCGRSGATAPAVRRFVGKEPVSALGRLALARVRDERGRPRRRRTRGARSVAVGGVVGRNGNRRARRLSRRADPRPTMWHAWTGASAPRILALRCAPQNASATIKLRSSRHAAPPRRNPPRAGALLDAVHADAREDLGYTLCRLHWLMRNDAPGSNLHGRIVTPKGGHCGCGQAGARRVARRFAASGHRRMVARASRVGSQAYRPRRCSNRLSGGAHRLHLRPIPIIVPNSTSWPAGLRCAFSTTPAKALEAFRPSSMKARPIRILSRVPPTGAAAPPRRPASLTRCARNTRPLPAILPLITASWHAPGSASTTSRCVRRRRR